MAWFWLIHGQNQNQNQKSKINLKIYRATVSRQIDQMSSNLKILGLKKT